MATTTLKEKDHYLAQFEQLERELDEKDPPWMRRLRKAAIARFAELGFPGPRNEDWKFTNLAALAKTPFQPAPSFGRNDIGEVNKLMTELDYYAWPLAGRIAEGAFCTLVNGACIDCRITDPTSKPSILPLWAGIADESKRAEAYLGRFARYEEQAFTALNTAFIQNGAFISVPKGTILSQPICLASLSVPRGEPVLSQPRCLIVVGANSQATIVETYLGSEGQSYFTNAVTEIVLGENASVDHYKVQREGGEAFHIANTAVHQAKGSTFSTHYIGLGGKLVRNEVRVLLDGQGCEATVNGLYLASGTQHLDNFTVIDHAQPHCVSHQLYKGIIDGKAHGVFNGKIFVRQDAQKTDAKQTNQTLLLSDDAVINTKPQLEIYADDVKCTHGATVGNLDEDALFYLRSRGVGREQARALLTFAFANDIIARIKVGPLRAALEEQLLSAQHLRDIVGEVRP